MARIDGTPSGEDIEGTSGKDKIYGLGGDDHLYGFGGNDKLFGGLGFDWLYPGAGKDVVKGGPGGNGVSYILSDRGVKLTLDNKGNAKAKGGDAKGDKIKDVVGLGGGDGKDVLTGNRDDNSLYGQGGKDKLDGGKGDDYLEGGSGKDKLDGGKGSADLISYVDSDAGVKVKLGRDGSKSKGKGGEARGDKITNVEWVEGSDHGDVLKGNELANDLFGLGGNDTLRGGKGKDELYGEGGNDRLFGDKGNDLFVFDTGFGHDVIEDFELGDDVAWIDDAVFDDFSDMLDHASQVGADVVVKYNASNTLTIKGTSLSQLSDGDFNFFS